MVPFFHAKNKTTCAKFVSYFNLEPRFEQGAGGTAEGSCEPEIAYAAWIWPFSPASNPAGPCENRTPLTRIYSGRRRKKKRDKQRTSFTTYVYVHETTYSFTKATRPEY
jgi:hypothetical protein